MKRAVAELARVQIAPRLNSPTYIFRKTSEFHANSATLMLAEIPDDEFTAAIDACASEALWEAGITAPPVDALAVADGLQLVVAHDYAMPYRGRFVRLADRHAD